MTSNPRLGAHPRAHKTNKNATLRSKNQKGREIIARKIEGRVEIEKRDRNRDGQRGRGALSRGHIKRGIEAA